MDFFEVVAKRRSIRKYKETPIEKEKLLNVQEAARLSPTWENKQCWRLIVVAAPGQKEKLLEAIPDLNPGKKGSLLLPLPSYFVLTPGDSGVRENQQYYLVDCGIFFEHLILAACAQGLGARYFAPVARI